MIGRQGHARRRSRAVPRLVRRAGQRNRRLAGRGPIGPGSGRGRPLAAGWPACPGAAGDLGWLGCGPVGPGSGRRLGLPGGGSVHRCRQLSPAIGAGHRGQLRPARARSVAPRGADRPWRVGSRSVVPGCGGMTGHSGPVRPRGAGSGGWVGRRRAGPWRPGRLLGRDGRPAVRAVRGGGGAGPGRGLAVGRGRAGLLFPPAVRRRTRLVGPPAGRRIVRGVARRPVLGEHLQPGGGGVVRRGGLGAAASPSPGSGWAVVGRARRHA